MCITDSPTELYIVPAFIEIVFMPPASGKFAGIFHSLFTVFLKVSGFFPEPVSYTHLDVYKRQRLQCMITGRQGQAAHLYDRLVRSCEQPGANKYILKRRKQTTVFPAEIFAESKRVTLEGAELQVCLLYTSTHQCGRRKNPSDDAGL